MSGLIVELDDDRHALVHRYHQRRAFRINGLIYLKAYRTQAQGIPTVGSVRGGSQHRSRAEAFRGVSDGSSCMGRKGLWPLSEPHAALL